MATTADKPNVVLFYKYFVPCPFLLRRFPEHFVEELHRHQRELCARLDLKGRVLLALEGINGTLYARNNEILLEYMTAMKSFDLARDCAVPEAMKGDCAEIDECHLYSGIDWKQSTASEHPFPDLKISVVKEIVSTGGVIAADDLPRLGGKHLSPREFHNILSSDQENVILIDVRNIFEHEIGHFVHPRTQEAAMNPNMVAFSNFDSTFCAKNAPALKEKTVLMYCTGGIRCEKASAMLRKRGVDDVYQLEGGIHRYLEEFGDEGLFQGKNFVFDQRMSASDSFASANTVVGKCVECANPYDEISGSRLCTVCRDLVLVCPKCQESLREYHCRRHSEWKRCYFTFLDVFDAEDLKAQKEQLEEFRESLSAPGDHRNVRRTLMRQIEKVATRMEKLESGEAKVVRDAPRRCRTCSKANDECDGRCWGFWKQSSVNNPGK